MKKILLAGTAIVGAAIVASPAQADLKIDLGGHFRGYAVYSDQDETSVAGNNNDSLSNFDFRRDMEVHFTGETTTDSGLTVGVHAELDLGSEGQANGFPIGPIPTTSANAQTLNTAPNQLDEAYMYFSGGWGRVNFGSEDGAAYLLQVAAPSADSNVDGMRVYIQALNNDVWDNGANDGSMQAGPFDFGAGYALGYDNALFRDTDRLSYLTPKWNGFQAGASYAPEAGQNAVDGAFSGQNVDDNALGGFEDLWELAARWDGEFEGFGISAGLGFSTASNESVQGPGNPFSDDYTAWDAGLNVSFNDFSVGAAYLNQETGVQEIAGSDAEIETWTVGAAWDNGPYHLGATWYNTTFGDNPFGLTGIGAIASVVGQEVEIDRWTVGGGYTYGPGMTFRGSVAFGNVDSYAAANDTNFTQVSIGTDVNF